MNILKHGDPDRIKAKKQFICYNCGCEFEAEKGEYFTRVGWFEPSYFCTCPDCNEVASEVNRKDDSRGLGFQLL